MPSEAQLALTLVITIDLRGVMVLDAGHELVEQFDELGGGLVGKAR